MTTYNTGNPVGSAAVKDIYDNAENLDKALNDTAAATWTDRLGRTRRTYVEIERLADPGTALDAAARAEEAADRAAAYDNLLVYISYDSPSDKRMVDDTSQPVGTLGRVTNDADPDKNGDWVMTASGWEKSDYQLADQKQLTEVMAAAELASDVAGQVDARTQGMSTRLSDDVDPYAHKLVTKNGRLMWGFLRDSNFLETPKGLRTKIVDVLSAVFGTHRIQGVDPGSTYIHGWSSVNGRLLFGWDRNRAQVIYKGVPLSTHRGMLPGDVFFIGDSITRYGIASSAANDQGLSYSPCLSDQSWPAWAQMFSGGRVRYAGQSATGGYTVTQVMNTHLPVALAAKPTFCHVLCGRNDIVQGVNIDSVTIPAFIKMFRTLRQNGIIPIIALSPAQGNSSNNTRRINEHKLNNFLRAYALKYGYPLIDYHRVTVDPATGDWLSGYGQDVSHPTGLGAREMGRELARVIVDWIAPTEPIHADEQLDLGLTANLVPNPLFLTTSGGEASGWIVDTAGDVAIETDPAVKGNVWRLGQSGNTARHITFDITPGKYSLGFYLEVGNAALVQAYAVAGAYGSTAYLGGIRRWATPTEGFKYFYYDFTVAEGATSATIILSSNAADLRVAQLGFFKRESV